MVSLDVLKIINDLQEKEGSIISVHGHDVSISIIDRKKNLLMQTQVYFGGNYIPQSVKNCISKKPSFDQSWIYTYLTLDEPNFAVHFNYKGATTNLNLSKFKGILDEFCWLADEWRLLLDEEDKNDLVHVKV